LRALID